MNVERLPGSFGVTVRDVDLAQMNAAQFAEVEALFLEHELLTFPDQQLDPQTLKALGRRFGELDVHPFIRSLEAHPEVLAIVKEPEETTNFGGGWHSEVSFYERPAMATMLYAVEVPRSGGDTLVASQTLAYDALSPGMRHFLDGLTAIHSGERVYGPGGAYQGRTGARGTAVTISEDAAQRVAHPVVRVHPVTGRRSLYVNPAFTLSICGLRRAESDALLGFLFEHCVKAEFCSRIRWQAGTLTLWDNRCTQHYALNDYPGERREMLRVVVRGDRPRGIEPGAQERMAGASR
jgi:taurine dioxygenase